MAKSKFWWGAGLLAAGVLPLALLSRRYYRGKRREDEEWYARPTVILKDLEPVQGFTLTPLIDWNPSQPEFLGEAGVAYYLEVGDERILFDLGLNRRGEHPSPLLQNMAVLRLDWQDINMLVISHAHADHLGGLAAQRRKTLSPSGQEMDFSRMKIYAPEQLTASSGKIFIMDEPRILAPGVASLGSLPRQDFFMGYIREQVLAIRVKDKGTVLIVGCGHPGVERILIRAAEVLPPPIYGIVGGLHFPVSASRINALGIPWQRFFGIGRPPWSPITLKDVESAVEILKSYNLKRIALSAHDSCDAAVEVFRQAFGPAYREIRVGEAISF